MKKLKILFVHNRYKTNGGEDTVLESERNLLSRFSHPTDLLLRHNRDIKNLPQKLKTAAQINYSRKSKSLILDKICNFRPDIVHVHNFFPLLTPSIYDACRNSGIPVVQTLHNFRTVCPGALLMAKGKICEICIKGSPYHAVRHRCYRNSFFGSIIVAHMVAYHRRKNTWNHKVDKFIALTHFSKSKFVASGFSARKIAVKPNFYYESSTLPLTKEKRKGALFVGRLSREKGILTLLQAWEKLDILLKIAGEGPMMNYIKKYRLPNISALGSVSREEVSILMSNAAFLVMPSECYENFPLVLVEAFANGLPVVVPRLGSMAEIVENGITGIHFIPGSPISLAEKAQWMFNYPEECQRMGENARKVYEEKYTPENNYHQLIRIYEDVIEEYRRGRAKKCSNP